MRVADRLLAPGAKLGAALGVVVLGCSLLPADSSRAGTAHATSQSTEGPYSSAPNHPWNRVHRALFVRTDANGHEEGIAALDPLLWSQSTYLEHGPKHTEIVEALDAFLDSKAASLVRDPVRRAVFQRDLWAVFDWLSQESPPQGPEANDVRANLQRQLARVIGQVALSAEEIRALPDNYARAAAAGKYPADVGDLTGDGPVLPADLLAPEGDWVALEAPRDTPPFESFLPLHAESFEGRSAFSVHLKLPGGRAKTIEYLERLSSFDAPRVPAPPEVLQFRPPGEDLPKPVLVLNPETPQLPPGSAVALVRRTLLVDRQGHLAASPLVESVQIRFFRSFGEPPRLGQFFDLGTPASFRVQQRVAEFVLDRAMLFAGEAGGLRPIGTDERVFETFNTYGFDPFEQPVGDLEQMRTVHMDSCVGCHGAPGIFSVQVYTRINGGPGTQLAGVALLPTSRLRPARIGDVNELAVGFKSRRYEWGLLQGLLASTAPLRGG
jgi:hypothetical protein